MTDHKGHRQKAVVALSAPVNDGTVRRRAISIARARELLGDDGVEFSDDDVEACCQHAQLMAQELIDHCLKKHHRT